MSLRLRYKILNVLLVCVWLLSRCEAVLDLATSSDVSEIFAQRHVREKRSVSSDEQVSVSPMATAVQLNISHLHLMVHWAGQGSSVVFCLGRDQEMKPGATSHVFRSDDYGLTYKNISSKFMLDSGGPAVINKFYHHPKSFCRYVFTDTVNRYIYMSNDCGETFVTHSLDVIVPSVVEFDERRDNIFLIHDLISHEKRLYVTKNYGETFSPVQDYVKKFVLRYLPSRTELFVQRLEPSSTEHPNRQRTTILSSTNFFEKQKDTRVVYTGAEEFQIMGDYMFVTRSAVGKNDSSLDLFVSAHGERFVAAKFDDFNLTNLDYHLVDVTDDGEILIIVNHNSILSNLYVSSRVTPYEVTFTLSLERVMYYSPNLTWRNSWLADTAGDKPFADVYKVQGLRGIYIASQLSHDAWVALSSKAKSSIVDNIEPKDLISLITFNNGGQWSPIKGPRRDEEGRVINDCVDIRQGLGGCALHLAQQLSKKFPSTRSVPIMSSSSAVGIIVGSGNVGTSLKQRSNVFLSADAGVSWHQVLKGSYHFQMGDHGGIIVAVKYFKTEGSTNELLYSTNEGIDWQKLIFYSEPLRVFGLLTEPGENTTVFTIFGTTEGSFINWIVVRVDLKSVFDRNCTEDDYKRWSPSDSSLGKHRNCLLGRKQTFERRVVNAKCFNGRDREFPVTVENCACDRSDYQCDFGFHRQPEWSGPCVKDPQFDVHDFYQPPAHCEPGQFYNQTRGYVKIRGDTCVGGKSDVYEPLRLPCPLEEETEFMLVAQRLNILRIDLRSISKVDLLPLSEIKNIIALDFDMENNCVFYGDIELDKVIMQCLNGSAPKVLVENNLSIEGMSFDWIGKMLYFVDGQKRTIEVVRTDLNYAGHMRKTIMDKTVLGKPRGIVVHPQQGLLFYSDWHESDPHIGRAHMDGSERTVIGRELPIQWPNGLTIDPIANRLYWVDAQKDYIASCDLSGKSCGIVLNHSAKLVHPFAVAVHKELVYWDDWEKKAIYMADKNKGHGIVEVKADLPGAMDLKIYDRLRQPAVNNSCSSQPCSHLCVPTPNGFSCLCPDGFDRHQRPDGSVACMCPDGKTEAFSNGTCPATIIDGKNLICIEDKQFTCDNKLCIPKRWHCDGENDCGDGSDEKDCAQKSTVCSPNQFMCANGERCIPQAWRCDFDVDCSDGSDEQSCNKTTCGPNFFQCTNGQCISTKWRCDLERDCQDGSDEENCTTVIPECKEDEFQCGTSGQCFPLTWKCDGENDCPGGEDEKDCQDSHCPDWQFACNDGHCIFQSWKCDGDKDCSDGSDEINCTNSRNNTSEKPSLPVPVFPSGSDCNEWMFRCKNDQCIPYWWKCDGSPDCVDSSDEVDCGPENTQPGYWPSHESTSAPSLNYSTECSPTKFACSNGECIWQAWVCDGENDCTNGEDEDEQLCAGRPLPCDPNRQFQCERSGQCISYSQICDGHQDCTDNSDEIGCGQIYPSTKPPSPSDSCKGPGVFMCDFNQCFPESAICDGHLDCVDGTDEPPNCQPLYSGPQVVALGAADDGIKSRSIRLDWILNDIKGAEQVEYQPAYTLSGENNWVVLNWTKIPDYTFTLDGLYPYTRYDIRMKTRIGTSVTDSGSVVTLTTAPDVPGPPTITDVRQINDVIQVNWTAPSQPNGILLKYLLTLKPLTTNEPVKMWATDNADQTTYIIGSLEPDQDYEFTVKAVNTHYTGNASKPFRFTYKVQNKERVVGLEILTQEDTRIVIRWKKPIASQETEYRVTTKSDNLIANHPDFVVKNSGGDTIDVPIKNLSPNTSYAFSVSVVVDGVTGSPQRIFARTTGKSLPVPRITDAQVTPESGTAIKLTWAFPDEEKRQEGWTFGIYYGNSYNELVLKGLRNETESTSFTVKHLSACENYIFVVAVVGPKGVGMPSPPYTKLTKYSPGAAPKNLKAELDPKNKTRIVITWEASCSTVDPTGYVIHVEDVAAKTKKQIKLLRQNSTIFRHLFEDNVRFGTTYRFFVQTDVPDSTPSNSVNVTTIPIPSPVMLMNRPDVTTSTHFILWRIPESKLSGYLLDEYKAGNVSYRIYISPYANITSPLKVFNVTSNSTSFRLPMSELEEGRLYFVSVAMLDGEGYESLRADPVAIESPIGREAIVVSPTNIAGVVVPILLVMVALGAALAYYVQRNRRLTRSFQHFASRYSQASGSASILNQNSLDDDDDFSPIIRGFSDHEPLVVS